MLLSLHEREFRYRSCITDGIMVANTETKMLALLLA
jgi:hypothetical protein